MNSYARGYSLTRIGLVAILGAVLFTASFIYMTNRSFTHRRSTLFVRVPTADGLKDGDQVLRKGVQVGAVRSIDFGARDGVVINVKLTEKVSLSEDATAAMVAADIFGRQSLVLHDGYGANLLADGDTIAGTPPSSMTARMEDLGRSAQRMVGDTTTTLLHETLRNVAALSAEMTQLARQSRTMLEREGKQVHRMSESAIIAADNLAAATSPDRLDRVTTSITSASARLDTAMTAIQQVATKLSNPHGSAGKLLSDDALYERVTGSMAALESLLQDFRANPKRYIHVSVF